MLGQPERVQQFKDEIAEMRLPDTAAGRDRLLLKVGVGLMAVGVVAAVVAYPISHGTTNALQQRDAQVIAIIGLVLAVVGGALFLRYSMAQFLRFWLARLSYEQAAQTDRLIEAGRASGAPGAGATGGAAPTVDVTTPTQPVVTAIVADIAAADPRPQADATA